MTWKIGFGTAAGNWRACRRCVQVMGVSRPGCVYLRSWLGFAPSLRWCTSWFQTDLLSMLGCFPTFCKHLVGYLSVAWRRGWTAPTSGLQMARNLVEGCALEVPPSLSASLALWVSNTTLAVQNESLYFARQISPILIGNPDHQGIGEALLLRSSGKFWGLPPIPSAPPKQINSDLTTGLRPKVDMRC